MPTLKNVTALCTNKSLVHAPHFIETTATETHHGSLAVLDSSGKIPDGILEGSLVAMGSYNECVDIVAQDEGQENEYFRGQYCALDVKPFLPPKPRKYNPQHMFRNISQALPILKVSELLQPLSVPFLSATRHKPEHCAETLRLSLLGRTSSQI
ncbi:hypothetical protein HPB48_003925 [Haemaphysalis longicornis]|uniref:Nose resistant-to-fluoxetine protein N-terminal domain-containing protein n=1 Tax=Haemaphysalis longicornis TaxID=44386 RepID=A0A9J6FG66_HAELO|nr:hypothetical protein HPB48_003925 [Haemaphysalis longicornis]